MPWYAVALVVVVFLLTRPRLVLGLFALRKCRPQEAPAILRAIFGRK